MGSLAGQFKLLHGVKMKTSEHLLITSVFARHLKTRSQKHAEQSEQHLTWMVCALVSTSDTSPECGHGVNRAHMLLPSGSPKSGGSGNDEPRHRPRERTLRKGDNPAGAPDQGAAPAPGSWEGPDAHWEDCMGQEWGDIHFLTWVMVTQTCLLYESYLPMICAFFYVFYFH